ncbi:OLC1v1016447C1 [Oldenlandia corymbosa var. corymbosa]|uniref:OLC1v1016447C1 n=1 Tax=Oldenlandia corymbosa var. corymbosa TaxID=529605 RepID=A0AAV1E618_OLDCO|nr:OLC1v1016447C1 [Oldenlandia corymbosa var. corymbosa]
MDPDYEFYLMGDTNFHLTNAETEENEPQYEIFLNSLKQDGDVWVVQADERNGSPENHRMENVTDEVFDQEIRREKTDITVENVVYTPHVGSCRKKQRVDKDPDTAPSHTYSTQHNNEKFGRSAKNPIGKNERISAKVTKGVVCEASRNVEVVDGDYQVFLQNFIQDEDGKLHSIFIVGTRSTKGKPKPLAVPGRSDGDEDEGCICLGNPNGEGDSLFREQVMKILRKPYNKEERQRLAEDMKATKPVERNLDLRHGREQSYLTNKNGKSYLDHYPAVKLMFCLAFSSSCLDVEFVCI